MIGSRRKDLGITRRQRSWVLKGEDAFSTGESSRVNRWDYVLMELRRLGNRYQDGQPRKCLHTQACL